MRLSELTVKQQRCFIIVVCIFLGLSGCGEQEPSTKSTSSRATEKSASSEKSSLTAPPPAKSADTVQPVVDHYYVMRDAQKYGYEQSLSAADKAQGIAAKRLTMIQYLGLQDEIYQVAFSDPTTMPVQIAECSKPCEFVKTRNVPPAGYTEPPENIRAEKGTILWAIMQDAMNGKLERAFIMDKTYNYEGVKEGQVVPFIIEKQYFRAVGMNIEVIPESQLTKR